jgi:hypothetical protein
VGVSPSNAPELEKISQSMENSIQIIEPMDIINDQEGPTEVVVQDVVDKGDDVRGWISVGHRKRKKPQNKRKHGIEMLSNGLTKGETLPQVQGHATRSQGNPDKINGKMAYDGRHSRPMRP